MSNVKNCQGLRMDFFKWFCKFNKITPDIFIKLKRQSIVFKLPQSISLQYIN